ncbi:MAG TPA: hypothetical protein VJJ22_01365 [Candidatus Paceibacterota bacterium]
MAKKKGMYLGGGGSSPASYDPDAYEEYDGGGAFAAGVRIVREVLVGGGGFPAGREKQVWDDNKQTWKKLEE